MPMIIFPREFDASKLSIGEMQVNNIRKSAMVSYTENGVPSALRVQLSPMRCPFGYSQPRNETTGVSLNENKMTINLSVENRSVMQMFNQMNDVLVKEGTKNSVKFFGKKHSEGFIREFLKPNIKEPMMKDEEGQSTGEVNPKYPAMLSLNMYKNDGKLNVDAVDKDDNPIDINDLDLKGATITPIIQCTGVWIGNNMFGFTWKILKLRVILGKSGSTTISFRNDIDQIAMDNTDDNEDPEVESSNGVGKIPRERIDLPDSDEDN